MDMRITNAYGVYNTYPTKKAAPAARGRDKANAGDSVSLSAAGNEFNLARRAVTELPEVREARVTQLQAQLQSGTYSVSAADVAARIFAAL
jgi:flagellar biosynthesis anti-sigma factor FlgM